MVCFNKTSDAVARCFAGPAHPPWVDRAFDVLKPFKYLQVQGRNKNSERPRGMRRRSKTQSPAYLPHMVYVFPLSPVADPGFFHLGRHPGMVTDLQGYKIKSVLGTVYGITV